MKIFNVIAILCSLFIVVNGQTTQEYTFTLTIPPWVELQNVDSVNIVFGLDSYPMDYNQNQDGKYTKSITLESSYSDYRYEYTVNDQLRIEDSIDSHHPCIARDFMDDLIYRSLQNTNVDTLNQAPPCNVGTVQCNEFVYASDGDGCIHDCICKSIPVDKISTLKTYLAESSSFNGNCEMST